MDDPRYEDSWVSHPFRKKKRKGWGTGIRGELLRSRSIPYSLFPISCLCHSTRSATMGFSFDARVAGSQTANNATEARISGTEMNTTGSQALTPKRKLARKRGSQNANAMPT